MRTHSDYWWFSIACIILKFGQISKYGAKSNDFNHHHFLCFNKFHSGRLIQIYHKVAQQVRRMIILHQHERQITDIKFEPVKLSWKPEEKYFFVN